MGGPVSGGKKRKESRNARAKCQTHWQWHSALLFIPSRITRAREGVGLTRMVRPPAAERRKARTGPPGKQPQKVEPAVVALCYIGIPLGLVLFVFGLCGVFVLRDPDQLQWYSQTQLGELWRWLTEKNPFYLTSASGGTSRLRASRTLPA